MYFCRQKHLAVLEARTKLEGYVFDLKKELALYDISNMGSREKAEKLIVDLQNGNNPIVTVKLHDGSDTTLRVEAVLRYTNLNFY